MTRQSGSEVGKLSLWIKRNIYIKAFSAFLGIFIGLAGIIFGLQYLGIEVNFTEKYIKILVYISYILNKIPLYNLWTKNFEAWIYFVNFQYTILLDGFVNFKTWKFIFKAYMEILPLLLAVFPFFKYFKNITWLFKDYEKTLVYRNLKAPEDPIGELEKSILSEGTYKLSKDDYNPEETKIMRNVYEKYKLNKDISYAGLLTIYKEKLKRNIELYEKSLKKLRLELKTKEEWDKFFENIIEKKEQPTKYLYLFNFINVDYDLMDKRDKEKLKLAFSWEYHFKFLNIEKIWVSREFYIDSIQQEVNSEYLYKQYYPILLFYLNKQLTNFSMYLYTKNLDIASEFKKLAKWVLGVNAPGKVLIIKSREPKLETIVVDLYYRLYMFRTYLGIENDYMIEYIDIINKKS